MTQIEANFRCQTEKPHHYFLIILNILVQLKAKPAQTLYVGYKVFMVCSIFIKMMSLDHLK